MGAANLLPGLAIFPVDFLKFAVHIVQHAHGVLISPLIRVMNLSLAAEGLFDFVP